MKCSCGGDSKVVSSQLVGKFQYRRRACNICDSRWDTYEMTTLDLRAVKRAIHRAMEREQKAEKTIGKLLDALQPPRSGSQ
jgi:transcriptional regulator NrdR family protein